MAAMKTTIVEAARAFETLVTKGLNGTEDVEVQLAIEFAETAVGILRATWDARKKGYLEHDGIAHKIGDVARTMHTSERMTCVEVQRNETIWTEDGGAVWTSAWCDCGHPQPSQVFWAANDGQHGWACARCRKLTQVG